MTRFIYLRSTPTDVENGVYPQADLPVGCLAYRDMGNDTFAYGLSFLNSEVDAVTKEAARNVAQSRLKMACAGVHRKRCQGRFGLFLASGNSLREKVAGLIHEVSLKELHGRPQIRERVVRQLANLEVRLLAHKK